MTRCDVNLRLARWWPSLSSGKRHFKWMFHPRKKPYYLSTQCTFYYFMSFSQYVFLSFARALFWSLLISFLHLLVFSAPALVTPPNTSLFDLLWSRKETQVTALKSRLTVGPLAYTRTSNVSQTRERRRTALLSC